MKIKRKIKVACPTCDRIFRANISYPVMMLFRWRKQTRAKFYDEVATTFERILEREYEELHEPNANVDLQD